jgi:biopolymer transport protein ExbD
MLIVPQPVPIRLGPATLLPLSYVALIVLVISMVVTPALGGPYLPKAATGLPVGPNPLTAGVDEYGKYYLLETDGWRPVPDTALTRRISALRTHHRATTRLYLQADRDASYGRVLLLGDRLIVTPRTGVCSCWGTRPARPVSHSSTSQRTALARRNPFFVRVDRKPGRSSRRSPARGRLHVSVRVVSDTLGPLEVTSSLRAQRGVRLEVSPIVAPSDGTPRAMRALATR